MSNKEDTKILKQEKPKPHGGPRANSGRKPKAKRISNYERAIRMLDDNIEKVLQVLIDGLEDADKVHRVRCAELLAKKTLPHRIDLKNEFKTEASNAYKNMSDEELLRLTQK